jgi:hypothetical protein
VSEAAVSAGLLAAVHGKQWLTRGNGGGGAALGPKECASADQSTKENIIFLLFASWNNFI